MEKKNRLLIIAGILLVVLFLLIVLIWQSQFSDSENSLQTTPGMKQAVSSKNAKSVKVSSLSFETQKQTLDVNTDFTLKAMIDPKGKKISASELHVAFDPTILKLESITPSDKFSLILENAKIDNEKGVASVVVAVPLEEKTVTDETQLAIFNFKTLETRGQTKISFTDKSGAAADGESTNVIASLVPTTIIVK